MKVVFAYLLPKALILILYFCVFQVRSFNVELATFVGNVGSLHKSQLYQPLSNKLRVINVITQDICYGAISTTCYFSTAASMLKPRASCLLSFIWLNMIFNMTGRKSANNYESNMIIIHREEIAACYTCEEIRNLSSVDKVDGNSCCR